MYDDCGMYINPRRTERAANINGNNIDKLWSWNERLQEELITLEEKISWIEYKESL